MGTPPGHRVRGGKARVAGLEREREALPGSGANKEPKI